MNPPAFQFYPDDFIGGVSTMTQAEVGAYILLLCHQWSAGKLSDDVQRMEIVAKGKVSEHVLLKFPRGKNRRLEQEREKQRLFRESRAKNGKLGGRPRKASDNLVVNSVKPTGEPRKSSPSPISNLLSPIKKDIPAGAPLPPSSGLKEVFDAWNANPLFPGCLVLSDKRRRFLQVRLHDAFFEANWKAALAKLAASKFCLGNNDRGWRANFDWFIQPDSVAKIMEGKYENNGSTRSNGSGNSANRNTGTLNEGKASQYRGVGKVV